MSAYECGGETIDAAEVDRLTASGYARYAVTLETPGGLATLEVPSMSGPGPAGRRAYWSACSIGWGDLDEIHVVDIELLDPEDWT